MNIEIESYKPLTSAQTRMEPVPCLMLISCNFIAEKMRKTMFACAVNPFSTHRTTQRKMHKTKWIVEKTAMIIMCADDGVTMKNAVAMATPPSL